MFNNFVKQIKSIAILKTIFIVFISLYIIDSVDYPSVITKYNREKNNTLSKQLDPNTTSLIFLTVTGDLRYQNREIRELYKELEILHLLVISGSNISVYLQFSYIFIIRKSMSNYLMRLFLVIIYADFIGYPEPFVRAISGLLVADLISTLGIRTSFIREISISTMLAITIFFVNNMGSSFILSFYFATSISVYKRITCSINSRFLNYIFFSMYMSFSSLIISKFFFEINFCQSVMSNLLITPFYDVITFISYVVYLLPNSVFSSESGGIGRIFSSFLNKTFNSFIWYLNFIKNHSQNVC